MSWRVVKTRAYHISPRLDPEAFVSGVATIATENLPSDEEVRCYEERGWFICPKILPDALLDATRVAIEAHHEGHRDHTLAVDTGFSDWQPGDGNGVRNNEFCSLQNDGVRALALQPILGAIAARLSRSRAIRLFDDQAIYKPPNAGTNQTAVGWHTDHSYWSTCTSKRMLTAWIPLHDSDASNGTLYVVDGSHRWPEPEHVRGFNDPDLERLSQSLGREVSPQSIIPLQLRKGQVSFHHMRTLHASGPNNSGSGRFAVAVHLQDDENHYRACSAADGTPIVLPHDKICRRGADGMPDYTDPKTFQVLWPAQHAGSFGG
ncbi:MAG: phytanoyl-CoA dioxygenase family protein [Pseudomonadales bacterium]